MATVNAQIPETLKTALVARAKQLEVPVSQIIRAALTEHLGVQRKGTK